MTWLDKYKIKNPNARITIEITEDEEGEFRVVKDKDITICVRNEFPIDEELPHDCLDIGLDCADCWEMYTFGCSHCGSGDHLYGGDHKRNRFCGWCGHKLNWEDYHK